MDQQAKASQFRADHDHCRSTSFAVYVATANHGTKESGIRENSRPFEVDPSALQRNRNRSHGPRQDGPSRVAQVALQPLGTAGTGGCWHNPASFAATDLGLLLLRNTGCKQPCLPSASNRGTQHTERGGAL